MPNYCTTKGCGKSANFGNLGDDRATYCGPHGKLFGMVDITSKKCLQDGCSKQPSFGNLGDDRATYCGPHGKLFGMVDIRFKKCLQDNCTKTPSFGNLGDDRATYCGPHGKLFGMVDITSKKCLQDGCSKQAIFGNLEDKSATYCGPHGKLLGMINIKAKKCLESSCNKQPIFGYPEDKSATYCGSHGKLLGMINIKAKRCLGPSCNKHPTFGNLGDKSATYCGPHGELIGMVNIVTKQCETCNSTTMNQKYKPNCARCHFYLNPDDPRIKNYKTKEHVYMTALLEKFPQFKLDKTINGGCSKRRPDGFLDLLTHVIIVEIDENEHKSYDDACNNRRTMELSQDIGHRPIVFIRLNPDKYTFNGDRMKGSFSLTKKNNELKVVKKEFKKRLNSLIESVEKYMIIIPNKMISVEYLYFTLNDI